MRAHPSPDLQFNVILSFSNETSVFFATSSTLKSIILSPTTPKVAKALKGFLQLAISKLPIMTLTNDFVRVMMVAMAIMVMRMMMMMEATKMTVMVIIMFVTMTVMIVMMMMISQFD